jgi:hypothetical protein
MPLALLLKARAPGFWSQSERSASRESRAIFEALELAALAWVMGSFAQLGTNARVAADAMASNIDFVFMVSVWLVRVDPCDHGSGFLSWEWVGKWGLAFSVCRRFP